MSAFGDRISILSLPISGKLLAYWRASFLFRQTLLTYDRQLLITLRLLYSVGAFPLSHTVPHLFSSPLLLPHYGQNSRINSSWPKV